MKLVSFSFLISLFLIFFFMTSQPLININSQLQAKTYLNFTWPYSNMTQLFQMAYLTLAECHYNLLSNVRYVYVQLYPVYVANTLIISNFRLLNLMNRKQSRRSTKFLDGIRAKNILTIKSATASVISKAAKSVFLKGWFCKEVETQFLHNTQAESG